MSVLPVSLEGVTALHEISGAAGAVAGGVPTRSFANMLLDGADTTAARIGEADRMVRQFVLDDSAPLHQVTFALEQARLSLELMVQVRGRLLEGYQQLMNMQL